MLQQLAALWAPCRWPLPLRRKGRTGYAEQAEFLQGCETQLPCVLSSRRARPRSRWTPPLLGSASAAGGCSAATGWKEGAVPRLSGHWPARLLHLLARPHLRTWWPTKVLVVSLDPVTQAVWRTCGLVYLFSCLRPELLLQCCAALAVCSPSVGCGSTAQAAGELHPSVASPLQIGRAHV